MRIACVHIPHFYVQAARRNNPALRGKSIIIGGTPEGKGNVVDFSADLEGGGIFPSMPIRDAYRLCIDAVPVPFRRKEYALFWKEILFSLGGITLRMEAPEAGTAFLDITNSPGLCRSEDRFSLAVVELMGDQFALSVKIGIGSSRFVASQAALHASPHALILSPAKEKEFLLPIGVDRLPVSPEIKKRLALLGLRTLGHIGRLPISALLSQFGAPGRVMWELANGVETQGRIHGALTPSEIGEDMVCDGAIYSREQIRAALKDLLDKLCRELETAGVACRTIGLVFSLQNKTSLERHFVFHSPEACRDAMLRRIMAGLEWVKLESPVRMMSVCASALSLRAGRQEGLFRVKPDFSEGLSAAGSFLKTKYGCIPVVRVVEKDANTLVPDERFVFVEL
jgi:DNA polymerase-4